MGLEDVWFCLIAVLWSAYFVLEGFDFGVGMLLPFLPRDEEERGHMLDTIGPVWDGNEVWLVIAGAATFAAFPLWYATMFSGLYLALVLVLVLLIVRVVSFEWRGKGDSPRWRSTWMWANTVGSIGAPFVWGVALADLLHGLPIDSSQTFTGNFLDLFSAYSVFAGLATVLLFAFHGASFLGLKTGGALCERALAAARRLAVPAAVATVALLVWTLVVAHDNNQKDLFPPVLPAAIAALAIALAVILVLRRRSRAAFFAGAIAVAGVVATLFTSLYPRVMVSSTDFANSLTLDNAPTSHYALEVMTVVAVIVLPVILLYQGWTYHVFRTRVGGDAPPSG